MNKATKPTKAKFSKQLLHQKYSPVGRGQGVNLLCYGVARDPQTGRYNGYQFHLWANFGKGDRPTMTKAELTNAFYAWLFEDIEPPLEAGYAIYEKGKKPGLSFKR